MNNIFLKAISLVFIVSIGCTNSFAQIPPGYYSTANGLTGNSLKDALNDIIDGHVEFPYSSSGTDVWDILKETDKDTLDPSKVSLLYSGWTLDASQEYNSGNGWNREHVWAKSHGDFGTSQGPGTDAHAIRPTDISVNGARGNRWFDNGNQQYIDGDGATDCYIDAAGNVWEPRNKVKGDVARMIFYMATRYEGENGEVDLEMIDYLPLSNTSDPIHAKLSTLLQWHIDDPVDNWERNRNDIIYYDFQENRNPFIDHPEYVEEIWEINTTGIAENESAKDVKLLKVVDFLGREVNVKPGIPQLYLYSDGSVVKRILK